MSEGTTRQPRGMRRAFAAISVAALTCLVALGIAASASAGLYTQTQTLPVPPASSFAASAGGDGWDVALSSTQVFNVFHHNSQLQVNCHNQVSAAQCWPIRNVNGGGSQFLTSGHPGLYLDQASGKLYVYATSSTTRAASSASTRRQLPPTRTPSAGSRR